MAELECTCGFGESTTGTRQEIIEQRLASLFEITISQVHALLDLLEATVTMVLDLPEIEWNENLTAQRMADASGRTEGWIREFLNAWELASIKAEEEAFGDFPPTGTNSRSRQDK
jgi:hypothetical protein